MTTTYGLIGGLKGKLILPLRRQRTTTLSSSTSVEITSHLRVTPGAACHRGQRTVTWMRNLTTSTVHLLWQPTPPAFDYWVLSFGNRLQYRLFFPRSRLRKAVEGGELAQPENSLLLHCRKSQRAISFARITLPHTWTLLGRIVSRPLPRTYRRRPEKPLGGGGEARESDF